MANEANSTKTEHTEVTLQQAPEGADTKVVLARVDQTAQESTDFLNFRITIPRVGKRRGAFRFNRGREHRLYKP